MRPIVRKPMPAAMSAAIAAADTYVELTRVDGLRAHLADEQLYVCAYCEQKIQVDSEYSTSKHLTKIEHFHPQTEKVPWGPDCPSRSGAADADASLTAMSNVVLCCHGGATTTPKGLPLMAPKTCDSAKGAEHICEAFRNPKTSALPWIACVLPTGRLKAHPSLGSGAQCVIDGTLNLNAQPLVAARHEAWSAIHRRYLRLKMIHQGLSPARKAEFAQRLVDDAARPGRVFRSVALSYAERLSP
jgi:hypothetical protein